MDKQSIAQVVHTCPKISWEELTEKIRDEINMEEYLFYRTGTGDPDEEVFFERHAPFWEMECTACGRSFARDKERKNPPKHWTHCPACRAEIQPRQWNHRAVLDRVRFSYQQFQRGAGREMWLRSFKVWRVREDDGFRFEEYQRIPYTDGAAYRWTRGAQSVNWVRRREVKLVRWWNSRYYFYDNFWGGVERDEIEGSCLEYSQAQTALDALEDFPAYLALYVKHPSCEYLWKMGFGSLLKERERDKRTFNKCVNLKADKPAGLFKGLSRTEIKLFAKCKSVQAADLLTYRTLREAGACRADWDSVCYAQAIALTKYDAVNIAADAGVTPVELRKWHEKQARRSGDKMVTMLRDHLDYINQLARLEIANGELLPHDLAESHERLSVRLSCTVDGKLNPLFRARRHLLRWLCWKHDGLFIRPVDSPAEIAREGEQQRHCVGSYATRHANGDTAILVLREQDRPRKSYYTVEFDTKHMTVRQCRGYRNKDNRPEDRVRVDAFIDAWLRHLEMTSNSKGAA